MLRRLVSIFVFVPVAIVLIALAVANRATVLFTIDPFNPGSALLSWQLPLFVLLFVALITGLVLGSLATWFAQGKYRRSSRENKAEAARLLSDAQKRDAALRAGQSALPAA